MVLKISKNGNSFLYIKGSSHRIPASIKVTDDLALLLGFLWGDGCINGVRNSVKKHDWRVFFVGNDEEVNKTYTELVKSVFNIIPGEYVRKNKTEIYFRSRLVYDILNKQFGFPDGEKIGRLRLPDAISNSGKMPHFLCGLFSTDGCFTLYRGYPRISLSSATYDFIAGIKHEMDRLGFRPTVTVQKRKIGNNLYRLNIHGRQQAMIFFDKVSFIGSKQHKLKNYLYSIHI